MSEPGKRAAVLGSLSTRDRRLVLGCVLLVVLVAVVMAILAPREDDGDPVPSSWAATTHGAEAAYLTLAESGYRVERWERPLGELAQQADANTVLVLAEPGRVDEDAKAAVKEILARGGRVFATGMAGAALLPDSHAELDGKPEGPQDDCAATPEGFDAMAASGTPHVRPGARWRMDRPSQQAEYLCDGSAVVVTYGVGKGRVVWWANSMPMENAWVAKDGDLALLLASVQPNEGPPAQARIVWDESLHTEAPGLWSYAQGTPVYLLWAQLVGVGVLLVLSFARRSGPLLPDPVVRRDQPLEFVASLGALYDKAGASGTAVMIAYERFRMRLGRVGARRADSEDEMVSVANARAGHVLDGLGKTLTECAEAAAGEPMPAGRALRVVQQLWDYEREMQPGRFVRQFERGHE